MELTKHRGHSTMLFAEFSKTTFYALYYAIPLFLASKFLSGFIDEKWFGLVYGISGILSVFMAFEASKYLNVLSNYRTSILAMAGALLATLGLAFVPGDAPLLAISFFIVQQISLNLLWLCLNISLEEISKQNETGSVRGLFLTLTNLGILLAPMIAGVLYNLYGFQGVYIAAAFFLLPLFWIHIKYTKLIQEPKYIDVSLTSTLKTLAKKPDVTRIVIAQLVLASFFGVMVLYSGLYITENTTITMDRFLAVIMPIALTPFVIFPYGLGKIADLIWGEKEILSIGLLIMGVMCIIIPFISSNSIVVWAFVLFMSRVGASFVESMASIYFYKKVDKSEAGLITLFNNIGSVSMIFVPVIASILMGVYGLPMSMLFTIIGIVILASLSIISKIHDTL